MFEHRKDPLASRPRFRRRLLRYLGMGLGLVGVSLGIGIIGYHLTEGLGWLDALVNASAILSGMGPVNELHHDAGKWIRVILRALQRRGLHYQRGRDVCPVVHRFLHKFHLRARLKIKPHGFRSLVTRPDAFADPAEIPGKPRLEHWLAASPRATRWCVSPTRRFRLE